MCFARNASATARFWADLDETLLRQLRAAAQAREHGVTDGSSLAMIPDGIMEACTNKADCL
eukprot:scaffold30546_cov34-Tisochrysis_lutea.AAC.4